MIVVVLVEAKGNAAAGGSNAACEACAADGGPDTSCVLLLAGWLWCGDVLFCVGLSDVYGADTDV